MEAGSWQSEPIRTGTEALCRVMVEGQDADKVRVYANELAGIVEKALG